MCHGGSEDCHHPCLILIDRLTNRLDAQILQKRDQQTYTCPHIFSSIYIFLNFSYCIFTVAIQHFNIRLPFINWLVILGNCDGISIFFLFICHITIVICVTQMKVLYVHTREHLTVFK